MAPPIVGSIINGPSKPLPEYEQERLESFRTADNVQGLIQNFPSYDWNFGCSAVSQAMISAYQDRTGYPNLYTGPANGGVAPITDTSWPRWTDNYGDSYPSNPIVASRIGTDGRTIKGSIEDYWVQVNSTAQDPYLTGGWTQHSYGEAVGDYMRTSQSAVGNPDGATTFYTFRENPGRLTCQTMENEGVDNDGTVGRKTITKAGVMRLQSVITSAPTIRLLVVSHSLNLNKKLMRVVRFSLTLRDTP